VRRWRLGGLIGVLLLLAAPLAVPLLELLGRLDRVAFLTDETLVLGGNTLLLVGGTLALALPAGVATAVLLYRTDLPLRKPLRGLTILALFVPLPVVCSAWQAALGTGGWLAFFSWSEAPGRFWPAGLWPAILVHAVAALPWVVLIVGQGLRWVEGELEADALLAAGVWRVLWRVTLPRCRGVIGAAGLWVALQTASEITVTDQMQVRSLAEEVYLELWQGGPDALARSTAASLPVVLALALLVFLALSRLERALPPPESLLTAPPTFSLGWARWPCFALVLGGVLLLAGGTLGSLLWRAGARGYPPSWSAQTAAGFLATAWEANAGTIITSLLVALAAGGLTALVALLLCWLSLDARWFRWVTFALAAILWALPAPVVGIGLKEAIMAIVDWWPAGPLAEALYWSPSPVPVLCADLLRYLPCAVAVLWPMVRLLPGELRDSARVDGATPGQELRHVVWPLAARAALWSALVVAALSLGEVGAVRMRVESGPPTFAHLLWEQMHRGVDNVVAALCLLMLAAVVAGAALLALGGALLRLLRARG